MSTEIMEKPKMAEVTRTERTRAAVHYGPAVDIVEKADELTVFADMPGSRELDIDVNFENGTLTILGKVKPRLPADVRFLLREYGVGDFYRTFQVSEAIDASRITAEYADGVLILHLPKTEAAKPRKINVRTK